MRIPWKNLKFGSCMDLPRNFIMLSHGQHLQRLHHTNIISDSFILALARDVLKTENAG